MNSNLIPEQRVDKNGRLNTKHVRATKPQTSANVPPPTLPPAKNAPQRNRLTAGQRKAKDQNIRINRFTREDDLCRHLGMNPYIENHHIYASDEEIYAVLSVTSNGSASALLTVGHRTAESASHHLRTQGFNGYIEDRSAFCDEALARRITPQRFIDATDFLTKPDSEHYIDAVEVHSADKQLAGRVQDGAVNFSDIKEITLKRVKECKDRAALIGALMVLARGDAPFTAAELGSLLDRHPNNLRGALKLTNKHGAQFVLSLSYPDTELDDYLDDRSTNRERIRKLLTFGDQVTQYELANHIYKEPLSYEKLGKYFDSGLDISHAAEDDCTDQQLDAIIEGVSPGVSGGWL